MLTQKFLRECFDHFPEKGILRWRERPLNHFNTEKGWRIFNKRRAGTVAGSLRRSGYIGTSINGKFMLVHRVMFIYETGDCPRFVDHINGVTFDNRWSNLRHATREQNNQNATIRKNNTSGVKGVHWNKQNNTWSVRVQVDGKRRYIGHFDDLELAELVAQEAREHHHGEFARHD